MERILLDGSFISKLFADALRIGESIIKSNNLQFNLQVQNDDVLYNSENPVNPDSKTRGCRAYNLNQRLGTCLFLGMLPINNF